MTFHKYKFNIYAHTWFIFVTILLQFLLIFNLSLIKKYCSLLILFQKYFVLHFHQTSKSNTSNLKITQQVPLKYGNYLPNYMASQPRGHNINTHRSENLKPHTICMFFLSIKFL
jgi:hypothetical protein